MKEMEILRKQEEMLQFPHFDQEEGYKLGVFMTEYARKHGVTIAISIRLTNGYVVYQYGPEGTGLINHRWMYRKYNTVCNWQKSSLLCSYILEEKGQNLATHSLPEKDYTLLGGGFPIRVKNCTAIVGVISVSYLYHVGDHEFIIDCLKEYLNQPDVPTIGYQYK